MQRTPVVVLNAIATAAMLACHAVPACAQTIRVEGRAEAVRIEVANAPLRDVLAVLQSRFGLRYRSQDSLDATRTLTLHAPLHRVVARLLEGHDFVIAIRPDGVDVLIMQQGAAGNVVIARLPPPAPAAPATAPAQAGYRERD